MLWLTSCMNGKTILDLSERSCYRIEIKHTKSGAGFLEKSSTRKVGCSEHLINTLVIKLSLLKSKS